MRMNDNNNKCKNNNVVFDAVHVEYKDMAPWYDRFWKTYTNATLKLPLEEVKARIVSLLGGDDGGSKFITVVDVGCGTGTFLKHLYDEYNVSRGDKKQTQSSYGCSIQSHGVHVQQGAPLEPLLKLYGIEPSEEMLQRATTKFDNVGVIDDISNVTVTLDNFPAEQLPLEDNSMDIVVCTNAFHFFRNKQQSLCEIHRVLKSSNDRCGTLILTDWCNDYMIVKLYHFIERIRWNWMHRYKDAYPSPLRRDELAQLVEAAGLCIHKHVTYRVRVFSIFFWGMQSIVASKRV